MLDFVKNQAQYPDELQVWQVAEILHCSRQYIYALLHAHKLPFYKIRNRYIIAADDLVQYIESSRDGKAENARVIRYEHHPDTHPA